MPLTTANRLVGELTKQRMLDKPDDGFRLGTRLFKLGEHILRERRLRPMLRCRMEDLYEVTHQPCK